MPGEHEKREQQINVREDQEILKWFYKAEQMLRERFDLDTSDPKDTGRISFLRVFERGPDDEPLEEIKVGKSVGTENEIVVEPRYALARCPDNGEYGEYADPLPDNVGGRDMIDWLDHRNEWFHVNYDEQTRQYTIDSGLSDKQLADFFKAAKNNRIIVTKPGATATAKSANGTFMLVNENNEPYFWVDKYDYLNQASDEDFNAFFAEEEHREKYLSRSGGDREAGMAFNDWVHAKNGINNPDGLRSELDILADGVQTWEKPRQAFAQFTAEYWKYRHDGKRPMTRDQVQVRQQLNDILFGDAYGAFDDNGGVVMSQMEDRLEYGHGLENFFLEDREGELVPLFADYADRSVRHREAINKPESKYLNAELYQTILDAMEDGRLCFYDPAKKDFERLTSEFVPGGINDAERDWDQVSQSFCKRSPVQAAPPNPVKPRGYLFKKIFSFIPSFKRQVTEYDDAKTAYDEFQVNHNQWKARQIETRNNMVTRIDEKVAVFNEKRRNEQNKPKVAADVEKKPEKLPEETAKEIFAGRVLEMIRRGLIGKMNMRYEARNMTPESFKDDAMCKELWEDQEHFGKFKQKIIDQTPVVNMTDLLKDMSFQYGNHVAEKKQKQANEQKGPEAKNEMGNLSGNQNEIGGGDPPKKKHGM